MKQLPLMVAILAISGIASATTMTCTASLGGQGNGLTLQCGQVTFTNVQIALSNDSADNGDSGRGNINSLLQRFCADKSDNGNGQASVCSNQGSNFGAVVQAGGLTSAGFPEVVIAGETPAGGALQAGIGGAGATATPEPLTLALMGSGLVGLGLLRRRKKA